MANFRTAIRTTVVGVACTYTTTIGPIWFTLTIAMAIHWASWSRTIVAPKTTIALTLAIAATNAPYRTTAIIFA